jgi:HD-GYP domain-containing protein (c-di-GMP phosphodiesterase class II)
LTQALRRRGDRIEQRDVDRLVREEVALRTEELEREKLVLRGITLTVLDTIVTLFEAKDEFCAGHSQRVAALAGDIAAELGLDPDTVGHVQVAGRLHDIGNVAVSEPLMLKPAPLTPQEFEGVRDHVRIGVQILTPIKHLAPALPYVRDHHEHWDGTGYPSGLAGEAISIGGRILAVADAFVAVTSGRAYFHALTPVDAVRHLAPRAGTHFDPGVIRALERVVARSAGTS